MTDDMRKAIAGSLGDADRDFEDDPLTDEEIYAIVQTYSKEIKRPDLDPELREIYQKCIEILKNNVTFH